MRIRIPWMVVVALGVLAGGRHAQAATDRASYAITTQRIPVEVGTTRMRIIVYRSSAPGPVYLNVHEDERTAVRTALARLRCCGGRLIEIQHGGGRYISFRLHGTRYRFDPNRIFTDRGARASLKWLGPYSPAAFAATRAFARRVLAIAGIGKLQRIVTVHNNTPGHYSAATYLKGAQDARDAASVYIPRGADPDDFFFVTSPAMYDELRAEARYAVVLQDNRRATDDGSLSVYAARHGITCITVEAQAGHRQAQTAMFGELAVGVALVAAASLGESDSEQEQLATAPAGGPGWAIQP